MFGCLLTHAYVLNDQMPFNRCEGLVTIRKVAPIGGEEFSSY